MFKSKKSLIKAISLFAAILLSGLYLLYNIYLSSLEPYKTHTVLATSIYKTVNTEAFVVRNEKYLTNNENGTVVPLRENGGRVATGDTVAVVLQRGDSAPNYAKKKAIEQDIAYYENVIASTYSNAVDIKKIDSDILESVDEYVNTIYTNNLAALKNASGKVRDNITHRQTATGKVFDFTETLTELRRQLESMKSENIGSIDIKTGNAGYFINEIDGFENTVDYANAVNMTVSDIDAALSASAKMPADNTIGKTVPSFDWYLVCNVDTKFTEELPVGKNIIIDLPNSSAGSVHATVHKINDTNAGRTAVIFSVNEMNEELSTIRKENIKIRIDTYSGYRIDNRAIRVVDEKKGVYVIQGNTIYFKLIDVIYSEENFSIIAKPTANSGYLKLYDEVIIEGTELYDKKLVK